MKTIEELVNKYSKGEHTPTLDELYDQLGSNGTSEEKNLIADAYLSNFGQCHYDYMCGKLELEWIWDMLDWVERIKNLTPDFDQYLFYKAKVYEMLSSETENPEDKIKFNKQCIGLLREQLSIDRSDDSVLIDLAENLFQACQLNQDYEKEHFDEINALLLEALHLERENEDESRYFEFNGTAIHSYLYLAYDLLTLPIENNVTLHRDFINSFKESIASYVKQDATLFYHWAKSLTSVIERVNHPTYKASNVSFNIVSETWKEVKEILASAKDIVSDDEHFLTSIGHLFNKIAENEQDYAYFETAFQYYSKALAINGETWTNPVYASQALQSMAHIHLQNNERDQAIQLYDQALMIYEKAQEKVNDFQLSVYHGEFLFDYAKYLESFSNTARLVDAKERFEESRVLGKDFYTSPYYGLAKAYLQLDDKEECLKVLKTCCEVFSNEYHTHDFGELANDKDFEEVMDYIPEIMAMTGRK